MNRGGIAASQLFWLAFVSMVATLVLALPGELLRWGGRGAWWTPLVVATVAVPLAFVVGRAAGNHGDAVRVIRRRLGPVAGRGLLLLVWLALAIDAAIVTREVAEGASTMFVHALVPVPLLAAVSVLPGVWLAWLGPVSTGRVATAITPAFVVGFVLGAIVVLPLLHVPWARPLLPTDARFLGAAPVELTSLWLVEPTLVGVIVMGDVLPSARARAGSVLAAATAAGALLLAATIWLVIADFGPVRAAEFAEPLLHVAQELPYSIYLEHLDSLAVPIEILAALVKIGVFLWLWVRVSQGIVDVARAWMVPSLAALNVAGSIAMFANALDLDRSIYRYTLYIVPTLLLLFAVSYLPGRAGTPARPA